MREKSFEEKLGGFVGYGGMVIVFTVILYFILQIVGKLPNNWNYFNVFFVGVLMAFVGRGIKFWLESL